jgi:hypothetical protein
MATALGLPEGFELDEPQADTQQLPAGFVLDEQPEEEKGIGTRLGERFGERFGKVKEEVTMPLEGDVDLMKAETLLRPAGDILSRVLYTGAQAVGAITDIPVEIVRSAYRTLVPNVVKGEIEEGTEFLSDKAKEVLSTPEGQNAIRLFDQYGIQKWKQFEKENPADARILKSMPEFLGVTVGKRVVDESVSPILKKAYGTLKDVNQRKFAQQIERMPVKRKKEIIKGYDDRLETIAQEQFSGIGAFKGKTAKQAKQEITEIAEGTKAILQNVDNIDMPSGTRLPTTVDDYAESIAKTKDDIWNNNIAPALGMTDEAGFRISLSDSINDLRAMLDDRVLMTRKPELENHINRLLERLQGIQENGGFTAREAQRYISEANKELTSFYGKASPEYDTRIAIEAVITNRLRKQLDEAVDLATGEGIQPHKNKYKALLSVEQQVNQSRNRQLKKLLGQNSPSYFDLGTDWGVIGSIVSMNPKLLISSLGVKALAKWQRTQMSPDSFTTRMFSKSSKLAERRELLEASIPKPQRPVPKQIEFTPRAEMADISGRVEAPTTLPPLTRPTTRALPAPSQINLGMKDVSGIPKPRDFTTKEWQGIKEKMTKEFARPEFWDNNPDLIQTALKLKANEPIPQGEMNELLRRIMLKINPRKGFPKTPRPRPIR